MTARVASAFRTEDEIARPGVVVVRNPAGEVIATIDPATRERRDVRGQLEAVLTPQGWELDLGRSTVTLIPHRRDRDLYPYHTPRDARSHQIVDRESRSGLGKGGRPPGRRGRPRKVTP